jgi:transposase-like protein
MKAVKLAAAARMVEEGIAEILTYTEFPREHRRKIRTNNPMAPVMREI